MGQWKEKDVVYAYTKRRDVGAYECFVGAIDTAQEISIKEAGEHCQRDIDPNRYGMRLRQTKYCNSNRRKVAKFPSHRNIAHMIAVAVAANERNNTGRNNLSNFIPKITHHDHVLSETTDDIVSPTHIDLSKWTELQMNETGDDVKPTSNSENDIYQHGINSTNTAVVNESIQFVINNKTQNDKKSTENSESNVVSTSTVTKPRHSDADESSNEINRKHPRDRKPFKSITESDFNSAIRCGGSNAFMLLISAVVVVLSTSLIRCKHSC